MIGGSFVRGVSGGERKRVCIGNEIIINPSLLFLDEPTSGLDSTTALRIVQMLHDIAEVLLPSTLVGIYLTYIFMQSTSMRSTLMCFNTMILNLLPNFGLQTVSCNR